MSLISVLVVETVADFVGFDFDFGGVPIGFFMGDFLFRSAASESLSDFDFAGAARFTGVFFLGFALSEVFYRWNCGTQEYNRKCEYFYNFDHVCLKQPRQLNI